MQRCRLPLCSKISSLNRTVSDTGAVTESPDLKSPHIQSTSSWPILPNTINFCLWISHSNCASNLCAINISADQYQAGGMCCERRSR
ncbi:hypothetical protein M404DRAFT_823581 [Pisolithus tinctorius Marx 270]|uniref:Uncharacterized protein n=1 Tax=Pisolithus tinctorius Marx 270 TaxID=870435 RepID=A0A0C3NUC5_PISTI|nr:hypothetical protein M404DRAFT_823581 [Pisolithus tinctorius Marx 270]